MSSTPAKQEPVKQGPPAEPDALVGLASRMVFSLLKGAVAVASRSGLSMDHLLRLARLAYFEHHRQRSPRDLATVAQRLGLSLRSVGHLNARMRGNFFAPEDAVQPVRQIAEALLGGPKGLGELTTITGRSEDELTRALALLTADGTVACDPQGAYYMAKTMSSLVTDDVERRVDGLNHQMEVIADSVWSRFVHGDTHTAAARTWVFTAQPSDMARFVQDTIRTMRHGAVELEEDALAAEPGPRYAVTVAFSPIEEDPS